MIYFLLALFVPLAGVTIDPPVLFCTWQKDPCHTMTVVWMSGIHAPNNIVHVKMGKEYKSFFGKESTHRFGDEKWIVHTAEIEGLEPDHGYSFRVGFRGKEHKFRTAPENLHDPIKFLVGGDVYHDTEKAVRTMFREAAKQDPLFCIIGGDIAYAYATKQAKEERTERWFTFFQLWQEEMVTQKGYMIPLLPVIGNHEVQGAYGKTLKQAPFFYAVFPTPGKRGYTALDFDHYLSLVLLDSGHTNSVAGPQADWLKKTLKSRASFPYLFTIYHLGAFPSYRPFTGAKATEVRKAWTPLFEENSITAAFEHHDHTLKRTHLIKGLEVDEKGILYLGDGSMGLERPRHINREQTQWYLANAQSAQAVWMVTLKKKKATFEALSSTGTILDFVERRARNP